MKSFKSGVRPFAVSLVIRQAIRSRLSIFSMIVSASLTAIVFPINADAQLTSITIKDGTRLLPKGRFIVSYLNSRADLGTWWDNSGTKGTLSDKLSKTITWNNVIEASPSQGNQILGLLQANQIDSSENPGKLSGSVQGNMFAQAPVLGYGITDEWMVVANIPVVRFQMASDYMFTPSPQFQNLMSQLINNSQTSLATEMEVSFNRSFETLLATRGYVYRPYTDKTMVGDLRTDFIFVPAKQKGPIRIAASGQVVFPTAQLPDSTDLYQFAAGARRLGFGGKLVFETQTVAGFTATGNLGGLYLFSSTQSKRIPRFAGNPIDSDIDPNAEISGGASVSTGAQVRYDFPTWVGLFAGIQFQHRFSEEVTGTLFAPERYVAAGLDTDQTLTHLAFGFELSSVSAFLQNDFILPAAVGFTVGVPIFGMNTAGDPSFTFQGSMFF